MYSCAGPAEPTGWVTHDTSRTRSRLRRRQQGRTFFAALRSRWSHARFLRIDWTGGPPSKWIHNLWWNVWNVAGHVVPTIHYTRIHACRRYYDYTYHTLYIISTLFKYIILTAITRRILTDRRWFVHCDCHFPLAINDLCCFGFVT